MTLSQHVLPNMKLIMTKCIVSCPFQTQQQRNATASLAGAAHNWLEPVFYVYFKRVNVMLQLLAGVLVAPWTIVVTYIYQSINSLVPLSNTTNNRLLTLATNLSESGECWLHDLDQWIMQMNQQPQKNATHFLNGLSSRYDSTKDFLG